MVCAQSDSPMKELFEEHGVLVRHWARLQQSVTNTLRSQQRTLREVEALAMRLRGQLIVAHTQLYWGMGGAPASGRQISGPYLHGVSAAAFALAASRGRTLPHRLHGPCASLARWAGTMPAHWRGLWTGRSHRCPGVGQAAELMPASN